MGLSAVFILVSIVGLATTSKPVTHLLILKLVLVDVAFVLLFGVFHVVAKRQTEITEAALKNLKWRDRVRVRRAFNRQKLPAETRLKPAVLKYARAQADYMRTFTGNTAEPLATGLLLAAELILLNIGYDLLWRGQNTDIFFDVPSFAVIGVVGSYVGLWLRKRNAKALLAKNKE